MVHALWNDNGLTKGMSTLGEQGLRGTNKPCSLG